MSLTIIVLVLGGLVALAGLGLVLFGLARERRPSRLGLIVLGLIALPILCWLAWLAVMVLFVGPNMG